MPQWGWKATTRKLVGPKCRTQFVGFPGLAGEVHDSGRWLSALGPNRNPITHEESGPDDSHTSEQALLRRPTCRATFRRGA